MMVYWYYVVVEVCVVVVFWVYYGLLGLCVVFGKVVVELLYQWNVEVVQLDDGFVVIFKCWVVVVVLCL